MSAPTKAWKPRPLPVVKRHRVAAQKPWKAWIDPASGSMRYFDPNISASIFYDRRPPGVTHVEWLDAPPPQALVGTVEYDSADDHEDDDPYDIFASPPSAPPPEEVYNGNEETATTTTATVNDDGITKRGSKYSTSAEEEKETVNGENEVETDATDVNNAQPDDVVKHITATAVSNKNVYRRMSRVLPHKQVAASLGKNWNKHLFVEPDQSIADSFAKSSVYGARELPLWRTNTTSDLEDLGMEVQLYFRLLVHLFCTFFLLTLLVLPVLLTFASGPQSSGAGFLASLTLSSMQPLGNISMVSVAIAGNPTFDVSTNRFQVLGSVWSIAFAGVWVMSVLVYALTVNRLDVARESTSITHYAVEVSGLPSGVTKKEVQQFFSALFDPNKPGHLYDDGNRIFDESNNYNNDGSARAPQAPKQTTGATAVNRRELDEQLAHERRLQMEIRMKERQSRRGKKIIIESKNSMDARGDKMFAPHLSKVQWRSKRRVIHHDGTRHQKQVFFPVQNCDNTCEPEIYAGGFVAEVQFVYHDEGNVIQRYFRRDQLVQDLHRLRAFAQKNPHMVESCVQRMAKIEKDLSAIEQQAEHEPDLGADRGSNNHCPVTAFVVFNHETSYMRCIEAYHNSDSRCGRMCCQLKTLMFPAKDGRALPLRVGPAPDPNEILFENMGISRNEQRQRQCVSWLAECAVLAAVFGLVLACASAIGWEVASVVIVLANQAVVHVCIPTFARWERHKTKTARATSLTAKVFVCLFVNSALAGLAAQLVLASREAAAGTNLFSGAGSAIVVAMAADIVAPHIPALFWSVTLPYKTCHRWRKIPLTQEEANAAALGPRFAVSVRFATIFNTVAVSLVCSSGMPVLMPLACLSVGVSYWVDKIMLLRVYHQPPRHSHDSSDSRLAHARQYFEMTPLIVGAHFAFAMYGSSFFHERRGKQPAGAAGAASGFSIGSLEWIESDHIVLLFIAFAVVLSAWLVLWILNRMFGNCMVRTQLFCVDVVCGGDDDHYISFQNRRKKQSHGKRVQYLEEDESEEEEARRYHARHRCCRGATTCRHLCRCFSFGRRKFGSHPAFTELCVLTVRKTGTGKPDRMPEDADSLHDLHSEHYITELEKHQGWRLGIEKRRRLIYKTKLWTSKGQAFRRRHDEFTQMYTYESLLDEKKPYTYSIHATSDYQQVLREQLFAKRAAAIVSRKRDEHAAAARAAQESDAAAQTERDRMAEEEASKKNGRKLLPHEIKMQRPLWVKLFDSEHTAYYYLNQDTHESSWDPPESYASPRHAFAIRWLLQPRPRSALVIQQMVRSWLARRVYQKAHEREEEHRKIMKDVERAEKKAARATQKEKEGVWRTHSNDHMEKVHDMIAGLQNL
jgi:hypothetical protein